MRTRITADIDSLDIKVLKKCVKKALMVISNIESLTLKKSSSKGYHLIIWCNTYYTKEQIYIIRDLIGDDRNRIRLDKIRNFATQTLFNRKEEISLKSLLGDKNTSIQ
jgi:hypothetical protein